MLWPEIEFRRSFFLQVSINELSSLDDEVDLLVPTKPSSFVLGGLDQLKHHGQTRAACSASLGAAVFPTNRCERGFDEVRGSQVSPVLG